MESFDNSSDWIGPTVETIDQNVHNVDFTDVTTNHGWMWWNEHVIPSDDAPVQTTIFGWSWKRLCAEIAIFLAASVFMILVL
ncbi:hypothetical protein [Croceicoccus mobilis]|uniref:Uncharacterized protein n=1 Tax=Croceicoccus mobilis TaxID=1703339 RepID=A0A917DYF1_9SPHN|nr:hypothetical protein [Croceicoccus mobilis]GGD82070.1 hypothetical protein GCM10010990_35030 [Croceicoccus mobilis]